jgi:hypothetical protein
VGAHAWARGVFVCAKLAARDAAKSGRRRAQKEFTDVGIDFHDLFDATGLEQRRRKPLLHGKHDTF